jgi:hypothetical protein
MYFAETTLPELAGVLTVIAGMLLGFYGIIKFILNQAIADRHDDRKERIQLVESLKDVATSNQAIANETKKAAQEAKKRNGHLADLVVESKKQLLLAINEVPEQHVTHQTVDHAIINKENK